ncbi:MAG: hypothetical protein HWE25_05120 [Alphaproteobacteria bacterium]|nr:hypothetical protein [Alphaproteobacteria bacterium]
MRFVVFILCLIPCFVAQATAENTDAPLTIAAQETPGLLMEGADLPYNRLLAAFLEGTPVPYSIKIYPGQRGVMQWAREESHCLFGNITLPGHKRIPHSVLSEQEFTNLIFAGPFNTVSVHMFGLHAAPPIDARAIGGALVGVDTIAHTDTNLYAPSLRRLKYLKVDSALEAFRLLEQGRVSMVMAYGIDAAFALRTISARSQIRYNRDAPILSFEENLACWRTPQTEPLIRHVQRRIDKLRQSGELAKLIPTADLKAQQTP